MEMRKYFRLLIFEKCKMHCENIFAVQRWIYAKIFSHHVFYEPSSYLSAKFISLEKYKLKCKCENIFAYLYLRNDNSLIHDVKCIAKIFSQYNDGYTRKYFRTMFFMNQVHISLRNLFR